MRMNSFKKDFDRYKEVANAVYGRSVLEDFKKEKLLAYITGDHTAANIENACKDFLKDPDNQEGTELKNMFPRRRCRDIPKFYRRCHKKFSDMIRPAGEAYRTTHANTSFVDILLELPQVTAQERSCIQLLA